jgi:hypothetical protein
MPEAYILKETENYTVFYFEDLNFWPLRHKLVMFHHWDYDDSNENTLVKNGLHISYDIEDNGFYLTVEKPAVHEVHVLVEETYGINEFYFPKENEEDDTEYVLDENDLEDIKVPYVFTNVNELFDMSQFSETGHAGICGITRSGKSTLLISMVKRFLDNNAFVLYRDDGGGEFRYLAYYYENGVRVFIPEGPVNLKISVPVTIERFDWRHPSTIIQSVYRGDYPLNVIVFDSFANPEAPKMIGRFYYRLLRDMLSFLQRKSYSEKYPLVFALDELNDIAAPRSKGYSLSEEGRAFVSLALRKTGKHYVKILCSTHRLAQLTSDFRSQIDNIFIKRYAGGDAWAFLKDNTITFNKFAYLKLWKIITTMPPSYFLYFDRYRRFDLYKFADIPRPKVDYECIGVLGEGEGRKAVCPKCGFTWTYRGDRDETRCPKCKAHVYFDSE